MVKCNKDVVSDYQSSTLQSLHMNKKRCLYIQNTHEKNAGKRE